MPNSLNKLYIGTMSGTSFDGIDVCAISVRKKIDLVHFSSFKYPPKLRKKIAAVIENQILSLKDYGELNIQIGLAFAKAINTDPEKFFTEDIMERLEQAAAKEFKYGETDQSETDDAED